MPDNLNKAAELNNAIANKIAQIRAVENDIGGVIIIHDIRDWSVVHMSDRGLRELNITLKELQQMGTEYHKRFFNPNEAQDYVPGIIGLIERNNNDEFISHFQQVRLAGSDTWIWHASSAKILMRDSEGKPLLILSTAIRIDPKHHFTAKIQRLIEENNFLRRNSERFQLLTKKERSVLKFTAMGMSSKEIAGELGISETTAATHRRNIKSKLELQNNYDFVQFAQSFNLI